MDGNASAPVTLRAICQAAESMSLYQECQHIEMVASPRSELANLPSISTRMFDG